jgi:hypothetical protein
MKLVLSKLVRLGLALCVLYGALLALSLLAVPRASERERIDTARASQTLYLTEPKYVFLARQRLATSQPKLLLLGASNTMAGFKQRELEPLLPEVEVHNLAVGGSNISELSQVVALVQEVQAPAARRHTTYVFGLWYGMFASDEARFYTADRVAGDTDIDIERYRYGFYRRSESGPLALLPATYLDVGVTLIHPYLVMDKLARDLTVSLRARLSGKAPKLDDEARNARVITPDEQRKYLAFWRDYMGATDELSEPQVERLRQAVAAISAGGGRVLLVDMPIPSWHAHGSKLAAEYARRMQRLLPELATLPGVSLLSLSGVSADADFSDEVHPKPRVSPRWAALLADALRSGSIDISAANSTSSDNHG